MQSQVLLPRRRLLGRLAGAAALGAWAPARAAGPVELEFWTMQLSPQLDDWVGGLLRRFEAEHPGVRVKWVDLPWAEAERKLLAAIAAGAAPDVVNLNPQFAAKLAEFGALADPEQDLAPAEIADYLPAAWQANRLAGRCFALPWYLSTNLTLYNRRALQGLAVPASHDELLAIAPQIRARSGQFAYFPALDGSTPLETLVAMGAPLLDASGCRAGFATDPRGDNLGTLRPAACTAKRERACLGAALRGAHVFDFYRTLYTQGLTPRNVVSEGHRKAVEMFLSGQVAVVSSGMQFLSYIRSANPQIYADIEVAPQLRAPGQAPGIAAMNLVVPARSRQRELAMRLARFVTAPAQQSSLAERVPVLPSTKASYEGAGLPGAGDADLLGRARRLSVEHVLAGTVQVPPLRNYGKLRNSYARGLQSVMLGKRSRDEALAEIGRQWAGLLGCNKT